MPLAHPNFGRHHTRSTEQKPSAATQDSRQTPPVPSRNINSSDRRSILRSASPGHENQSPNFSGSTSPPESRHELIERIKKERDATWLEDLRQAERASAVTATAPANSKPRTQATLGIETISESPEKEGKALENRPELGSSIERPRSALHSGDFREHGQGHDEFHDLQDSPRPPTRRREQDWLSASPTTPWYSSGIASFGQTQSIQTFSPAAAPEKTSPTHARRRAASYSTRPTDFVFKLPTSPLAIESNNDDLLRPFSPRGRQQSPGKSNRRRTFSPRALHSMRSPPFSQGSSPASGRALPNLRREGTFPYQAHQPRRSLNSFSEPFPLSIQQTPGARSRRPSIASESSPLQRLPMVGRYEESILRGRMSSLPSRPLDFVAQIGVLGKGQCKSSLRCPPHVTVPFPAVFYNYGNRPGSEGPSPYVGIIDLENFLKPKNRPKTSQSLRSESPASDATNYSVSVSTSPAGRRRRISREQDRKPSILQKAPPKGSYRIPQHGQLQIIIKNPNKTAVKLFLVPYDLTGMEAGQKTFIRQRSYSAGPIIDMPLTSRINFGTDRPEAAITNSEDVKDRPMLRYLIHLNICCPARRRFYLYKSIRVVFANRVPDGREKLRQEIQLPDPKYSTYKPEKHSQKSSMDASFQGTPSSKESMQTPSGPTGGVSFLPRPISRGSLKDENQLLALNTYLTFPPKHSPNRLEREPNENHEDVVSSETHDQPSVDRMHFPASSLLLPFHLQQSWKNSRNNPSSPPEMFVQAIFDYEAEDDISLSLKCGDCIKVLTKHESGWWDGILDGKRGWFPSNCCESISETKVQLSQHRPMHT